MALRPGPALTFLSLALAASSAVGDEPADPVAAALGRRIVEPRQSLNDARAFVEARLPEPPAARSPEEWKAKADALRERVLRDVVYRGEAAAWRDAPAGVEYQETLDAGPGYRIRKLRLEVIPDLWVPALLYEPDDLRGVVPVVLNVNGHDFKGKAAPYKQIRCINQAKRGMIALNLEWFGMGQLAAPGFQHGLINAVDLCGSGGIALHFLAMRRALDVLLSHEHADPQRVAVTGLSGGGWQTIFFSSLEPRVTLTTPVAGYSGFRTKLQYLEDLGDSEQTPCDLATVADYTHLTALMAPRPALLVFNAKDQCCFAAPHALPPLVESVAPIYRLFGQPGNFRAHVNHDPGDHNYGADNRRAFYQFTADLWSRPGQTYNPQEIPSDDEVRTEAELAVALPADNLDFQKLTLRLAKSLPIPPASADPEARRARLRSLVRPIGGEVVVSRLSREAREGLEIQTATLRIADAWTVPIVRIAPAEPVGTTLVLADEGRATLAPLVKALLADRREVVAIDPYYLGEGQVADHAYLWSLMIAVVGERPLGVQVGEVLAAARAFRPGEPPQPVRIVTVGPRSSTIALIAAALDPQKIQGVELHQPLGSFQELLEEGRVYDRSPELFCFGLLREFDVKDIAAELPPHTVRIEDASQRARSQLGGIAGPPGRP